MSACVVIRMCAIGWNHLIALSDKSSAAIICMRISQTGWKTLRQGRSLDGCSFNSPGVSFHSSCLTIEKLAANNYI